MSTNFNVYKQFMNGIDVIQNSLKEMEKDVNITEVEEIKVLLEKYDIILKDDIDEKDLISKYETNYDKLNEFVINKSKEISDVEDKIEKFVEFTPKEKFNTIITKKNDNINQITDCLNRIVEKIKELESTIHNNRMKELDNMKAKRRGEVKQVKEEQIKEIQEQIKQEIVQPIKVDIDEMGVINNSTNILKQWSNKNTTNILFDSKVDGDGSNNILHDKVINKSNVYFITFDTNNNVFGGYVSTNIKDNCRINDNNSFVFSLIRNGKVRNTKYLIKPEESNSSFYLYYNKFDYLYNFGGNDINVRKIGYNTSYCKCCRYNYNNEQNPFIDPTQSNNFQTKRIIIIEMN